jgi:hypothetical protein
VPLRAAEESMSEMIDDVWPHEQGEAGAAGRPDEAGEAGASGQPDEAPAPGDRPWLAWSVGERVVIRYRIERTRDGGPGHTDALGYLVSCSPDGVTVRTRTGDVVIPAEAIAVGKRVPPPPLRRSAS